MRLGVLARQALWVAAGCGGLPTEGLKGETGVTAAQVKSGDRAVLSDGRDLLLIAIKASDRDQPLFQDARASGAADRGARLGAYPHRRAERAERAAALLAAESAARDAIPGPWVDRRFAIKDAERDLERLATLADARGGSDQPAPKKAERPGALVVKSAASAKALDETACSQAQTRGGAESFQRVEGRVRTVFVTRSGGVHLKFADDYKTDFSAYIGPGDAAVWAGGAGLQALQGQELRARVKCTHTRASACSRSAMMSRTSSMPIDSRTASGNAPASRF
jgi:hypothetical protein